MLALGKPNKRKNSVASAHSKKRKYANLKGKLGNIFSFTNFRGKNSKQKRQSIDTGGSSPDKLIFIIVAILCFFGWIMIYSGSFYVASQRANTLIKPYNSFHFFLLQGIWLFFGTLVAYIVYKIPVTSYKKLIMPAILAIVILLVVVLILPAEINGAKLWIRIGPFSLQPSEFAKPALIIYMAAILTKEKSNKFKNYEDYINNRIIPFALLVLPIVLLVLAGKDLATAGLIGMVTLGMFFLNDNHKYTNMTVLGLCVIGILGGVFFTVSEGYRMERVNTYLEVIKTGSPENPLSSGYQLNQILIAVGSGGFDGYGFGQSRQKYYYLQETAFNDTIFAVVAEEFGFIGSVAVIIGYSLLTLRGIIIVQHLKDPYLAQLALGVTIWIFLQAIIHLGVNVGMIPLTGITLPFMSYGGSSLISCLIGMAILLNVSKHAKLE